MKLSTFYTKTVVRMFFQKSQVLTVCLLWSFQLFNSKGALPPGGKTLRGLDGHLGNTRRSPFMWPGQCYLGNSISLCGSLLV